MERSPTTARFAVPVSEPSQIRLDEIVGHLGLEIGVTIEPTDYASSDEFSKRETGMRIKISADDLAALKTSKLWTFTYEKEQGTVIAVIKITAQQRPVTPIADIKELNGTWRLVDAHLVRDQALGLPFHDLEGYKSARIAIDGPEWRHVRQGNELFRTLEATYDLTASPQKVDLKFTFRESEKHERRLIELHGDELITAKQIVSPADGFPGSFDEPMVLIERYQRVGVVINRNEVDETVITISLGTSDGIRLNQQFQVTDASSVLGTVEAYEIGKHVEDVMAADRLEHLIGPVAHPPPPEGRGDLADHLTFHRPDLAIDGEHIAAQVVVTGCVRHMTQQRFGRRHGVPRGRSSSVAKLAVAECAHHAGTWSARIPPYGATGGTCPTSPVCPRRPRDLAVEIDGPEAVPDCGRGGLGGFDQPGRVPGLDLVA